MRQLWISISSGRAAGWTAGVLFATGLGTANPAAAQTVLVRVITAEAGAPVQGAFVSLLADRDSAVAAGLTDGAGLYTFRDLAPGTYRLQARMLGRETVTGAAFQAEQGATRLRLLRLPAHPFEFSGFQVERSRRCSVRPDPDQDAATARLWEEARTALEVARWALDARVYRYELEALEREYSADGRRIERESTSRRGGFYREPYRSRPAGELLADGFVQPRDEGALAFAPDAAVLLSDAFLDTHCFRATAAAGADSVGLTFEPVSHRNAPDIEGTLWMDRRSGALRSVSFRYVGELYDRPLEEAGGEVRFDRLPSGAWVVRRWVIRTPILTRSEKQLGSERVEEMERTGVWMVGGQVLRVLDADGQEVVSAQRAALAGVVVDSVTATPLSGARVSLRGTEWRTATDASGHFQLPGLPGGPYELQVSHPFLDSLGITEVLAPVTLNTGSTSWVDLAIPRRVRTEAGQGVTGLLRGLPEEGESRTMAVLEDGAGRELARAQPGAEGRFELDAPGAGSYRVRAERPGYHDVRSPPLTVGEGEALRVVLKRPEARVRVAFTPAAGAGLCRGEPEPDTPAGKLWGEARKALARVVWTGRQERVLQELLLYDRERAPADLELWDESIEPVPGLVVPSFPSESPARLMSEGFVRPPQGDTAWTFAPTPEVLLSAEFEASQCFRVVRSPTRPDLLGLGFGPVVEDVERSDVRGVFWMDGDPPRLRSMDYRYTRLPGAPRVDPGGGWMDFRALPDGSWITSSWGQRIPDLIQVTDTARRDPTPRWAVPRLKESGGVVRLAADRRGDTLWVGPPAAPSAGTTAELFARGDAVSEMFEGPAPGERVDSIEGITVEVARRRLMLERVGFTERARRGLGVYLTREDIERRQPRLVADLLDGMSGVRVVRSGVHTGVILTGDRSLSFQVDVSKGQACRPTLILDGRTVEFGGASGDPLAIDDFVSPDEIAGMEVYTGASRIPTQFNANGACGVLVVWTGAG